MELSEQAVVSAAVGMTSAGNWISSLPLAGMAWVGVKLTLAVAAAFTVLGLSESAKFEMFPLAACHVKNVPQVGVADCWLT